ncbi:MAG TPA: hydrogenase maturation protease [Bacteroidales bacterium]|nr:hydrogenase maturation protease [Bacteroidales bacterium]
MTSEKRILIYGYGNPGRQDDGLGVLLAERIEKWAAEEGLKGIVTDSNYQLNLEDAEAISGYDTVIFADASQEDIADYLFSPLVPSASVEFTMHAVSPAFILHLCHEAFNRFPDTYLLHIKGYSWEFMNNMTPPAKINLEKAVEFVKAFLKS